MLPQAAVHAERPWRPAACGTYRLVVDEEEIFGLSFLAYRRTATMLHIPGISVRSDRHQVVEVDPEELAAALDADALA
ncbi:hypothetical protein [Chelativorans salis]|uniref:Uncharacterized protein n=1 Tax=Chelativorans salis TaxID=2978478 RepID=A0ABT2LJA3_9HYPH|nr:hypothetical protein [Chelativorans sp. EGI FJ00035]MCT7374573.1 hypothetical protein [Chelativorans sp. EGI FJ00035]